MSNDIMVIAQDVKMELKNTSVMMPKNYSFENAVKAAHLTLQGVVDKNKRPALDVCTKDSVHKALLFMAIQGLNPAKVQCYFTVFGNQLQCMVSQFGDIAVAMRVNPKIKDIRAACIYKGDQIEIEVVAGQKIIKKHTQTFESLNSEEIIGCYAMAIGHDDEIIETDMMTMHQVKQSWKQSKRKDIVAQSGKVNPDSTHGKFPEEMVKKTIFHRICKKIIRSSDDSEMISAYEQTNEETPTEIRVQSEIKENANQKLIDIPKQPEPEPEPKHPAPNLEILKKIMAIEKHFKRDKTATLANISGFLQREIKASSELTEQEAQDYLDMIKGEYDGSQQQEGMPEWA